MVCLISPSTRPDLGHDAPRPPSLFQAPATHWTIPELLRYTEHKGCFDMLRAVVSFLNQHQHGRGVVAVSPDYAAQVAKKLSVMWALPRGAVCGILNALPMPASCLAASLGPLRVEGGVAGEGQGQRGWLEGVFEAKSAAKRELQVDYGLEVEGSKQLVVFMGRMTHQKVWMGHCRS